jgi:hypothetical protein
VFLGLWDEWEIPGILEDHGLIDDLEAQHMQDLLQDRGNFCRRKNPAEIPALGPSCASHPRSSNANANM